MISENNIEKSIWLSDDLNRIVIDIDMTFVSILKNVEKSSERFDKNCEIIFGIKPYQVGHGTPKQTREDVNARIYHSDIDLGNGWYPLITGTDINRFSLKFNNNSYIKYGKWLMYMSNEQKITHPKLLLRRTSADLRVAYDDKCFYPQNSLFIITSSKINIKHLMVLLNSKLFAYFYKNKIPQKGKIFAEVKPSIIKSMPIKPKNAPKLLMYADEILDLNMRLQQKAQRFINRTKDTFEIQKTSKKLNSFYDFDFKTFLAELKKQKITLSLHQQDEWEDYFTTYKTEINHLQTQISQTDNEIDQMVYKLYGLTDEEIAIVEGG